MRVLVLHSELGVLRGGGENFTRNLFTAFAGRGHTVAAAFVADLRGMYPIPLPSTIEPIAIPGWWSRNPGQRTLSSISRLIPSQTGLRTVWDRIQQAMNWRSTRWHDLRFQRRIEQEFARRWSSFDVAYVHGNAPLAGRVAQHLPTILRLPGPTTDESAPVLRAVHAVCANGDALIRIRQFLGDHAVELPIGVDSSRFRPGGATVRSRLGWKDSDRVVGYVGRLTHLKGVDLLADAFREVARDATNIRLLVVGSGTEGGYVRHVLRSELATGAAHIEPHCNHEALPSFYRAMDLLVMPSRYENFSNAILEALACSVPFLGSDVGGNRILAATGSGWLFKSQSAHSLGSEMQAILDDAVARRTRGERGLRYARDCCSWTASAARLEEIISSLNDERAPTPASRSIVGTDSPSLRDSVSESCGSLE